MDEVTAPLEEIGNERLHKVFFAIPFDTATKKLYERIGERLRQKYNNKVITTIGTKQVQPSPRYSDIATFKAQNREMNEQFFSEIRRADVVIADLTHTIILMSMSNWESLSSKIKTFCASRAGQKPNSASTSAILRSGNILLRTTCSRD